MDAIKPFHDFNFNHRISDYYLKYITPDLFPNNLFLCQRNNVNLLCDVSYLSVEGDQLKKNAKVYYFHQWHTQVYIHLKGQLGLV